MSNSDFQARALYDFNAEGSNELSFRANDILTITSTAGGNGWWFARSSTGKVGVIPENYVLALHDPPEPTVPPPPVSSYLNQTPKPGLYNGNGNTSRSSGGSGQYDPPTYMNPIDANRNWPAPETPAWPAAPPLPSGNKLTPLQTLNFPTENSLSYTASSTRTLTDDYMTVVDVSPTDNFVPFTNPNPSTENNLSIDLLNGWYDVIANTPVPATTSNSNEQSFQFDFPQSQTNTSNDHFVPLSKSQPTYSNLIDEPLLSASYTADVPISMNSRPSVSSDSTSKSSSPTKVEPLTFTSNDPESTRKKKKKRLPKILHLSLKGKNEVKKDSITEEATRQRSRKESDSDDSFDSDYTPSPQITNANNMPSNTASSGHARTSLATTETTKGSARARFFDKHGLDNYLLNGCKAQVDEHVKIGFDEREGGVYWAINPNMRPFICKVEDPTKGTKLGGIKTFIEYKINSEISGNRTVGRRYKQFDWLHEQLVSKFRFICIPPLPGKQIAGRFEQEFVQERRRLLELWLNRICRHPVLCASYPVQHFMTCELTEKNKKDWKTGKRKVEKDDLREAQWLQCVEIVSSRLSDPQITSQIDIFGQQQPNLESQLKNLSQGLGKYIERQTEVYERDIQRVGEMFSKVHQAVQMDTTTIGNKELSNSISKISGSYNGMAELYKTKASEGLRDFNERIQEYIGLIGCFPSILSLQRSAADFIKTNQQRGTADFSNAVYRVHTLNHVVLAEINFFQKEKVNDLNTYLKTLVDEQIQFYEKITGELRDASNTFK